MDEYDPYTPVEVLRVPAANSERPYYIYATSIVLLLWAAVFVYLKLNYQLSESDGMICLSISGNFARRVFYVDILTVMIAIATSVLAVNGLLWCARKLMNRSGVIIEDQQ